MTTDDPYQVSTAALVSYLRAEADLAEERAKSLRLQADNLATRYGVTDEDQKRYEIDPDQLPDLDEHGIPKYKGKKRGRKPKPRKRLANPNRRRRQHTAYTMFMQETHPAVKAQNPDWPPKDVVAAVARQWATLSKAEKLQWKERAVATHQQLHNQQSKDQEEQELVAVDGRHASAEPPHPPSGGIPPVMQAETAAAVATAVAAAAVAYKEVEEEEDEEEEDEAEDDDEDVEELAVTEPDHNGYEDEVVDDEDESPAPSARSRRRTSK